MKFLRFGPIDQEKPGVLDSAGKIRDLSSLVKDLFPENLSRLSQLKTSDLENFPLILGTPRIGSCLARPGKILCIGYNSRLHTLQMGNAPSTNGELTVFLKPSSALTGPYDPIPYSAILQKLDWEAELGVVIGKKGKNIPPERTGEHIFGYACFNDLSERYWQFETADKQYTKGKGMDGFAPLGPYLVTQDSLPDPGKLKIRLRVNGELRQDFSTAEYTNSPEMVVGYLSRFFTLYPGDLIAMGSGPGNAKFWGEDKFLKPGDRLELEIEGLGRQEQTVNQVEKSP